MESNRTGIRTPCHEVFSYLLWTSTWQCPYISDVIHQLNPRSEPNPFLEKLVHSGYLDRYPKRCAGRLGVPPTPTFFRGLGMGIDLRSIPRPSHEKKWGWAERRDPASGRHTVSGNGQGRGHSFFALFCSILGQKGVHQSGAKVGDFGQKGSKKVVKRGPKMAKKGSRTPSR